MTNLYFIQSIAFIIQALITLIQFNLISVIDTLSNTTWMIYYVILV